MNVIRRVAPEAPAALLLVAVVAWVMGGWCLGTETCYDGDLRYIHLPFRSFIADRLAAGELPLWTPYARGGFPLHAYGEAGLLYPLGWPFLLLTPQFGLPLAIATHLLLGAGLLYAFGRHLGFSRPAALLAAVALFMGPPVFGTVGWINAVEVAAWVPALLLALDLHAISGHRRWLYIAGVVGALMLLAGRPQLALIAALGAGGWYLGRRLSRSRPWWRGLGRGTPSLVAAGALAVALAAPQIVPTWELLQRSDRAHRVPTSKQTAADVLKIDEAPATLVSYVGRSTLALAAVGVMGLSRRRSFAALSALGLAVAGVTLAVGDATPVYRLIEALPGFGSMRVPARFLFLYALGACLLAGAGASILPGPHLQWGAALLCLGEVTLAAQASLSLGPVAPYFAEPLAARVLHTLPHTGVDGAEQRIYVPNAPMLDHRSLPSEPDAAVRIASSLEMVGSNLAGLHGLRDVGGYGDLAPRRYDELLLRGSIPLLRLLACRYVVLLGSPPLAGLRTVAILPLSGAEICEVENAGPRAFVADHHVTVPDDRDALLLLDDPSFDPWQTVVLAEPPPPPPLAFTTPCAENRAMWMLDEPHFQRLFVERAVPGLLVIADSHDPGWKVTVNGFATPLLRAHHALRAVAVPAGRSEVTLHYRPASLRIGFAVLASGVVGVGGIELLLLGRRRRRIVPTSEPSPPRGGAA